MEMIWSNVFKIAFIHVMALYGAYVAAVHAKWNTLIFTLVYLFCSGLSVTAGSHRLWSHRSYKAKLPLRILLMVFNCMAGQNDIYDWVRDHRVHHKYSETDADPHNVKRGFFFAHVGWLMCKKHPEVTRKGKEIDCSDVYNDPVVRFQMRYHIPMTILLCFVVPTMIPYRFFGESRWNAFFVAAILRWVFQLNGTWLVNSAAHMWGQKPYDKFISPAENMFVSFLAIGEGFHNYHHTFPWDYSTSELGWKMNFSTMFIDFMAKVGWAYDLKKPTEEMVLKRAMRTGDGSHEQYVNSHF